MRWKHRLSKRKNHCSTKGPGSSLGAAALRLETLEDRVVPSIGFAAPDFIINHDGGNNPADTLLTPPKIYEVPTGSIKSRLVEVLSATAAVRPLPWWMLMTIRTL